MKSSSVKRYLPTRSAVSSFTGSAFGSYFAYSAVKDSSLLSYSPLVVAYSNSILKFGIKFSTFQYMSDFMAHNIIKRFGCIKVYSDISGDIKEYSHHAIEIFKEHGKYKVLDILHSDKVVWLETYLDELCKVNHCQRGQLRYDFGYLAPCHAFASNMQELSDLMRYLDKTYCIGKPRVTLMNLGEESPSGILIKPTEGMLLSDDMAMDFDEFGKLFGEYDGKRIIATYQRVYDRLMTIRFNMLHILCLGHIMRDPIMKISIAESIFDDAKICELMKNAPEIPGHIW